MDRILKSRFFEHFFDNVEKVAGTNLIDIFLIEKELPGRFYGQENVLREFERVLQKGHHITVIADSCIDARYEDLREPEYNNKHPLLKLAVSYPLLLSLYMRTGSCVFSQDCGVIMGTGTMAKEINENEFSINQDEAEIARILKQFKKECDFLERRVKGSGLKMVNTANDPWYTSVTESMYFLHSDYHTFLNKLRKEQPEWLTEEMEKKMYTKVVISAISTAVMFFCLIAIAAGIISLNNGAAWNWLYFVVIALFIISFPVLFKAME